MFALWNGSNVHVKMNMIYGNGSEHEVKQRDELYPYPFYCLNWQTWNWIGLQRVQFWDGFTNTKIFYIGEQERSSCKTKTKARKKTALGIYLLLLLLWITLNLEWIESPYIKTYVIVFI